jgi:hypothetical protein
VTKSCYKCVEFCQSRRLRKHLLEDYDVLASPRVEPGQNVTVSLGMAVIHFEIEEARGAIHQCLRIILNSDSKRDS